MDIILEVLGYIFMKIIFKGITMIGLVTMKIFTLNKYSLEELKEKYSIISYVIGIFVLIVVIYYLSKLI